MARLYITPVTETREKLLVGLRVIDMEADV
jgi:hypothetical protein